MLDFESMDTPMDTILKKLGDSALDLVDSMMYT
jgi:hypothetical protein